MSGIKSVAIVFGAMLIGGVALHIADNFSQGQIVNSDSENQHCLAYVSTDKAIYRAGERVFVRTVILDANNHKPLSSNSNSIAQMRITGPKGEALGGGYSTIQDGMVGFAWDVPAEASGGQYKVSAEFPYQGFPSAERKFEIRAYRVPRLKGEIIFLRDGFGASDVVKASLHVERAEGGLPAGAKVNVSAIVDGNSIYTGETSIDPSGNCSVQVKLPEQIAVGDGTLSLSIADGGVVEPISKTIPILVNSVDISFYPEGGDLISGLVNRVYFESRTPAKKPADIKGQVIDSHGQAVADVQSDHEGRGKFTFTPGDAGPYKLKLSQPSGISREFDLPAAKSGGVVLSAVSDVTDRAAPVLMKLSASKTGTYSVGLSKHDVRISSQMIDLQAGKETELAFAAPSWADGVLTMTVRDENNHAVAERLVYRKSNHQLHVSVSADKDQYIPAGSASVTVTTTDDDGKPVAAVLGLSATDASVLEILEQRDRAPRLREMVLLENDVRELNDAQVYLDDSDPKSPQKIDLLLGTQGWRRFATEDEAKFIQKYGEAGRRALADRQQPIITRSQFGMMGRGGGGGGGLGGGGRERFDDLTASRNPNDMVFADRLSESEVQTENPTGEVASASPAAPIDRPQADFILGASEKDESAAKKLDRRRAGADGAGAVAVVQDCRIYAHDLMPNHQTGQRQDFTETLYWAAGVLTSADTGKATVTFKLNDAVGSFKISADAINESGAMGEGSATIKSIQPFYVEPKLPIEVSAGDLIRLPIAAVNATNDQFPVHLSIDANSSIAFSPIEPFTLAANARDRRISEIHIGQTPSTVNLHIKADGGQYADDVTRTMVIKPIGFPTSISRGGNIEANSKIALEIEIPSSVVSGSIVTNIALYPTPVGNLTESLRRLMQEPNGCFEQTSSTTYPLVMADQYFISHTNVDPKIVSQSNALLDKGYEKLIAFECKTRGYEWFGEDPGHECLSAYALLEFTDMSTVRTVDKTMLEETRAWLMAHRDGKGGFTHERRALHTWIADPVCSNGYCTWALLETGQTGLEREIAWLKEAATNDSNSYSKALAANAMYLAGDHEASKTLMEELAHRQATDGHVTGATTSVVGSEGESLQIETTSLAALAWLREPAYSANVSKAIQFLASACEGGRYGSTQSTVLALRAIVAFDKSRSHPMAPGKMVLLIDGKQVGNDLAFTAGSQAAIKLPDCAEKLTPGKHDIELRMIDGSSMPYAMEISYNSVTPASSEQCKVSLTVVMKENQLTEGAASEVDASITNKTDKPIPTPIAIIGLPGGLEVRYDQLKELVKSQRIAAYEVRGRELILYWRDLQPNQRVDVPISVLAAIPGEYTGPASRAYLYYSDENKQWQEGLKVNIDAR